MVDATGEDAAKAEAKASSLKGMLIAAAGALIAGGAGFAVSYGGMLDGLSGDHAASAGKEQATYVFVPLDPLMVSLGPRAKAQNLRFVAELEVEPGTEQSVAAQKPRIMDVLNGYLRAVEESELEDPAALSLLRAQMLRRIQVVVGDGKVRDLLVLEFILN